MLNFFDENIDYKNRVLFTSNENKSITYGDWYAYSKGLKNVIPAKRRVLAAIICHNTVGSALSYLCCLQNRIVPLLIDHDMDMELRQRLLSIYKPNYIFKPVDDEVEPLYTLNGYGVYWGSDINHNIHPDLALLLTTSGSTGSPKLVRQSYTNIQANAESIAQYLKITAQDHPISSLPMHYTFGLSVINSHVLCGACECLTEATVFDKEFWDICQNNEITSIAGVPFTYECLKRIGFMTMNLPKLTLMIQAGGHLSTRLQKEYLEFAHKTGKRFIVMYGQTEATARMSYLPFDMGLKKIGSIGIAIPGGTFHIMEDEKTEITQPHVTGELCYEGPNVTLGYAHCADDLALGDMRHGRLYTGDMAYFDEDGYYYITGRKKRFIKVLGKRINMDEIEELLKSTLTTGDFACTGKDNSLQLFMTGPFHTKESVESFLIKKLGLHPHCFSIHLIKQIPKNSSGKTQYAMLNALCQNQEEHL
ncbi:AMP-binding protein [Megasphaera elsdenii]|uniref:AMP-binding protein n=1 Tax=Megasphaera elsdenii TaxID=907 RepID=UPI0039F5EFFB